MIAAIYARKSTEQNGTAEEAKSVTRQIDHAKAYAAKKGWTVHDEYIYVDGGVSGAEFTRRPGFLRLMNALKPKPPFQILIMSEESRLGREQIEAAYALKQIITVGVRVFYYLEDRERTLNIPTEKRLLSVATFADEMERVKARARTRDAMVRKARAGHVAADRKYGYGNVAVTGPDGTRSHVDRQMNETEATVVRQIFDLAAAGYGFRRIAHALNAEAAPAPRATHGRRSGWSASTVRDVLRSEVYRGMLIWGQTQKRDGWGQWVTRRTARQRPPEEWIRVERPDLRIVSEALWDSVQERLRQTRATYLRSSDGRLHGRPVNGIAAKYLLTGMAVCGQCGGALTIRTRAHGTSRLALDQCLTHVTKGPRICANRSAIRQREAETAVLETVRHQLLHPDDVLPIIEGAVRELQGSDAETKRQKLEAERDRLATELGRLAEAIAAGGGVTLVEAVRARETQRETLQGELVALDQLTQVGRLDRAQLEQTTRECLTDWQGLLAGEPVQARQMLRKLLEGRLVFTPTADGTAVEFRGTGVLDPVLSGIVDEAGIPKASGSHWSHHRSDAGFRSIDSSAHPVVATACCHSRETEAIILDLDGSIRRSSTSSSRATRRLAHSLRVRGLD
jgi:site-specific DNA recombinase